MSHATPVRRWLTAGAVVLLIAVLTVVQDRGVQAQPDSCPVRLLDGAGTGSAGGQDLIEGCVSLSATSLDLAAQFRDPAPGSWRVHLNTMQGTSSTNFDAVLERATGIPPRAYIINVTNEQITCEGNLTVEPQDRWQYMTFDVQACFGGALAFLQVIFQVGSNGDIMPNDGWVDVPADGSQGGVNDPPPAPPGTAPPDLRLGGSSRFETSAAIARYQFPRGATEVYLARADAFPDALSGAALDAGPILLVPQCGDLPAAIVDVIRTLQPSRAIALGGTGAVCQAVLDEANALLG